MKFIIATHNQKKLAEMRRILEPMGVEADIAEGLFEPEENGATFEENAQIKAVFACNGTKMPAIADDSGLCVDSLDGGPGVYTARYGGEGLTDKERYLKLLSDMKGIPQNERGAKFVCAICVIFPDGRKITARGECHGFIGNEPSGAGGFGYDPVFYLSDGRSFAELSAEEKDSFSHRGKALRELKKQLYDFL